MFLFVSIFGNWYHLTNYIRGNAVQSLQCYLEVMTLICAIAQVGSLVSNLQEIWLYPITLLNLRIYSFVVFDSTLFVLFPKRCFSVMSIEFVKQFVFTFLLIVSWSVFTFLLFVSRYRVLTSSLRDKLRVCRTLSLYSTYICFKVLIFRPNLFFGKLRWVMLPLTEKNDHLR